ncbi:MAG: class I SAM-dependent methyltransferase [Gammaproteobacteria bacterium]|nr:class I SAM-dependent methyltransferase [Gammaproteobacteria bacterium]
MKRCGEQSAGRLVEARASALQTASIDDFGCGLGHNPLPLCAAFPEAEIIAIDVAAPTLRYGHARARSLGVSDVIFLQAAAIDSPIEDSSCDLVLTTMVLHETSSQALPRIFSEAHRLLRARGLTVYLAQPPYRDLNPFEQSMHDWDGRFNDEPFWSALHESDLPALRVKAGFGAGNIFESRCTALPPSQTTLKTRISDERPRGKWWVRGKRRKESPHLDSTDMDHSLPKIADPIPCATPAETGRGPEAPQFVDDPMLDWLYGVTIALVTELAITRSRLDALERVLTRRELVGQGDADGFVPESAEANERSRLQAEYLERVLRALE